MMSLEVRGLRPEAVREQIQRELGGVPGPDGAILGAGWRLQIIPLPRAALGRFSVTALGIEVDGGQEAEITAAVRRMMMRGGG